MQTKTPKTENEPSHNLSATTDASPAPSSVVADRLLDSRIESLKRRQRADSFINTLTKEQSRQVVNWMHETEDLGVIYERVTAPPPEGLGVKTSIATLRRIRAHLNAMSSARYTEEILDTITDMELESDLSQSERIQHAISHLLHEKAFQLARTHPGSVVLKDVLSMIDKLLTLEQKRKQLALQEEKRLRLQQHSNPSQKQTTHHHRVDLNIISTPAPQPLTVPMQQATVAPPAPLHSADAHQLADTPTLTIPLQVVAPLPEVVT